MQFGLDYGVTNTRGMVRPAEVREILKLAVSAGIGKLDTAAAYGKSEEILGLSDLKGFKVYTKFQHPPETGIIGDWVRTNAEESLRRLGLEKLSGVYVHSPDELLSSQGSSLFRALTDLKDLGLIEKIGVSVYHPEQLDRLLSEYPFQLAQFPLSILDQRFLGGDRLSRWKGLGLELHARSVFLQGTLLTEADALPDFFHPWTGYWKRLIEWRRSLNVSPVGSCLYPILGIPQIDAVVLGVDGLAHLEDIIRTLTEYSELEMPAELACEDKELILPYLWKLQK